VSPESVNRFKGRLREELRKARGRNVRSVLAQLQPVLIGWVSYYWKSEVKKTFEDLDLCLRRKLRAIYWRQWRKPASYPMNQEGTRLATYFAIHWQFKMVETLPAG